MRDHSQAVSGTTESATSGEQQPAFAVTGQEQSGDRELRDGQGDEEQPGSGPLVEVLGDDRCMDHRGADQHPGQQQPYVGRRPPCADRRAVRVTPTVRW